MKQSLITMLIVAQEFNTCIITTAEDFNLDRPYAIDRESDRIFYETKKERDSDFNEIVNLQPLLSRKFKIL